jgi:hypothetical protein
LAVLRRTTYTSVVVTGLRDEIIFHVSIRKDIDDMILLTVVAPAPAVL